MEGPSYHGSYEALGQGEACSAVWIDVNLQYRVLTKCSIILLPLFCPLSTWRPPSPSPLYLAARHRSDTCLLHPKLVTSVAVLQS